MTFEPHPEDAYVTAGERYRTPSHPAMIEALGRAMWNALTLDQLVVVIMRDYGDPDWQEARRLPGGELEQMLRAIGSARVHDSPAVAVACSQAADAYAIARAKYRNALAHASPYTAGMGLDGRYLPGLEYHPRTGAAATRFDSPEALLQAAHEIEQAIDPLGEARIVVRLWRGLTPA